MCLAPAVRAPEAFVEFIRADAAKFAKIIKATGAKVE